MQAYSFYTHLVYISEEILKLESGRVLKSKRVATYVPMTFTQRMLKVLVIIMKS